MKKKLLALALVTVGSICARFSVGIRIGPPPPPRVVRVVPRSPGPDYTWVDGYWYPNGSHYKWHAGYWTRPPYAGAHWIAPRHDGGRFHEGYGEGDRGHMNHDHHWDRGHDRDWHR